MKNTYTNIILYYHGENSRFTNYRYTVEACYNDGYYYPLIAFNTKKKLLYWLNTLGLTFGKRSGNMIRINGSYSRCALMDVGMRTMTIEEGKQVNISRFPNFHKSGNITGMKRLYYGIDALLVRCGSFIYNVTSEPNIYYNAK